MVEGDQGSLKIRGMGPGTAVRGGRLVVGFPGNALSVSLSLWGAAVEGISLEMVCRILQGATREIRRGDKGLSAPV